MDHEEKTGRVVNKTKYRCSVCFWSGKDPVTERKEEEPGVVWIARKCPICGGAVFMVQSPGGLFVSSRTVVKDKKAEP